MIPREWKIIFTHNYSQKKEIRANPLNEELHIPRNITDSRNMQEIKHLYVLSSLRSYSYDHFALVGGKVTYVLLQVNCSKQFTYITY